MAGYTLEQLKEMHGEGGFTIVNSPTTTQVQQQPQQQGGGLTREQVMALGGTIVGEDTQPVKPIEPKKSLGTKILGDGAVGKTVKAIPGIIEKGRGNFQDMASKYQSSKITAPEFGLQILGNAAGVLTDIIGTGIGETVKAIGETPMSKGTDTLGERFGRGLKRIGNTPISQGTDTLGQRLGRGVSNIIGSQPIQAGVQAIEANPRLKANLQAVGNIASVIPVGEALGLATKSAKTTVRVLKPTTRALGEFNLAGKEVMSGIKSLAKKPFATSEKKLLQYITPETPQVGSVKYKELLKAKRIEPKKGFLQSDKYILSPDEKNAVLKFKDLIDKDPVKTTIRIQDKLSNLDNEVGNYLRSNNGIFNSGELRNDILKRIEPLTDLTVDPKNLKNAKNSIVNNFITGLEKNDMESLWKARKEFDSQIKNAFTGSPTLQKKVQKEFRTAVQDFISSRTDNTTYKAYMKDMSDLFKVYDLAELKAVKGKGGNKLMQWVKNNPTKAKLIGGAVAGTGVTLGINKLIGQ